MFYLSWFTALEIIVFIVVFLHVLPSLHLYCMLLGTIKIQLLLLLLLLLSLLCQPHYMSHSHLKLYSALGSWVLNQRSLGLEAGGDVEGFCPFGGWQMNHDASRPTHRSGPHKEKYCSQGLWKIEDITCFISQQNKPSNYLIKRK